MSIILKNFKVVSRNWSYFVVLVICPILLVLAAGAMLNSSSINNLWVGVIGDQSLSQELQLTNSIEYSTLADCIWSLSSERVGLCIYFYEQDGKQNMDIFLDNTEARVESFAKQLILEKVSNKQYTVIEQAGTMIYTEVNSISDTLNRTEKDLKEAYIKLDELESDLWRYKQKLSETRTYLDSLYAMLSSVNDDMKSNSIDVNKIRTDIQEFKRNKVELENRLNTIKSQLDPTTLQQVNLALTSLSNADKSLNDIDKMLQAYSIINQNIGPVLTQLQETKKTLGELDQDLDQNIASTQSAKTKVLSFSSELQDSRSRLSSFKENVGLKGLNLEFKKAYEVKDNNIRLAYPILIALIISFTAIILSNLFITQQVNHQSFIRDIISPTTDIAFLFSNYVVTLFFVFLQVTFLFILGKIWFEIDVLNNIMTSLILIYLVSSIFVLMGMSIGYLIRSQYLSMLISIFFVLLFFIFSNVLTPSILTGPIIRFFMSLNPFSSMSRGLTDIIILNKGININSFIFYQIEITLAMMILVYYISKKICNYQSKF